MNLETGDECELLSISVLNLCRKCNANKEQIALLGECLFGACSRLRAMRPFI